MTEKIIYTNYMKTSELKSLSKSQLIRLLLKQNLEIQTMLQAAKRPDQPPTTQPPNRTAPRPAPRKSVKTNGTGL